MASYGLHLRAVALRPPCRAEASCEGGRCVIRRRNSRDSFRLTSSCSQIRITRHPLLRSVRVTSRSRALLVAIFFRQNAALPRGLMKCLGHPCQKHPSTNTASFRFGNTKSGFPNTGQCLRQPVIPFARKIAISRSSVSLLPAPRMRAITSDRLVLVKVSGMEFSQSGFPFHP